MTEPQTPLYVADGMPRRTFLQTLGIASGSLMLSGLPSLQAQTSSSSTSTFQLKAPEPNPKYGGTLRYGILSAPAHFDVHQSGTVANIGPQSPMYDTLIRRSPKDGQTIIPDLAQVALVVLERLLADDDIPTAREGAEHVRLGPRLGHPELDLVRVDDDDVADGGK